MINIDLAYVFTQERCEFVEGIFDLCRHAKELGYLIFVVTNQAGIGRGYYTERDFFKFTDWMCGVFEAHGAAIDKVYFCPSHPEHGVGRYKAESVFRKPGPGMILQAAREFSIDLRHSVLVGDKESDIEAGVAAGIACNLLFCAPPSIAKVSTAATAVVEKLNEIRPFLVKVV